jgi:cyclophilin family peptidyl-prolyl cis-trans isomerase
MNRKSSSKKSRGFGFGRTNPTRKSTRRATFEPLETRQLLAVTLPTIGDQVVMTGAPLNLALASTSDHTVSYSVTVGDPSKVTATVPTNNTYLKIHVTDTADNINGDMVFQLFNDLAPKTVAWITSLVTENFYNGLIFHRIMDGFMIQGGAYSTDLHYHSPTSGTIDDEINANLQFTGSGLLAMAKPDGSDGNGAQFFITDGEARWLDFHHTIFGMLVEGASIRDKISAVPKDSNNFPNNFVQITSAQIITDTTDGVLRLSAPIGATGSTLVTVTAKDTTTNETSVKQFNVTLAPDTQDDPPFLTAINPIQTPVNTPITFTLPATDVDGGAIYYKGENTYDVSLTDVPNIKGTTKITLSVNSSTGVVTLTPAADLPPGVYSVRFSVGTSAAAINDAQEVPVYITSSAPTSITLAAASDTGNNSDKITSLNNTSGKTLQFTVNGVTAGNVVQLYADGALIGQANATGTSVTITTDGTTPLTDGTHAITAKQILKSQAVNVGNLSTSADLVSPASASLSVTVDDDCHPQRDVSMQSDG